MLKLARTGPTVITVPGNPVGKPRMTRKDKWAQRPCVLRYREWADRARAAAGITDKVRAGAFEKYWEDEQGPRVEIEIQ